MWKTLVLVIYSKETYTKLSWILNTKECFFRNCFPGFLFKILQFGWSCSYILNIILCMKDVLLKNEEQYIKPPVNVSGSRRVRVVFSRRIEFNCFVIDSIHLTTFFIHLSFLCKSIGRAKLRNATRIYYLMGIFGFPVLLIFLT